MATTYENTLLMQAAYLMNQGTVQLISNQTFTSAATSISFSSLPQYFNNLMIYVNAKSAITTGSWNTDSLAVTVNGNSSGIYNRCTISNFQSSGATGAFSSTQTSMSAGALWTSFSTNTAGAGGILLMFPGYTGTTFYKSMIAIGYATDGGGFGGLVTSGGDANGMSAALNQVTFATVSGSNLVTGSYFAVYGM